MPTYEYECEKCGRHFDMFQSMTEDPVKSCPKCKGKVYRLLGAGAGFIFKGAGFYANDYKKKDTKADIPSCPKADGCGGCSLGNKDKRSH